VTLDIKKVVITVDQDVDRPKAKRKPRGIDMTDPTVKQLQAMQVGDSFFLAGIEKKDARPLLALGKKLDVHLEARQLALDEIYQQAGVRVWRIDDSEVRTRRPRGEGTKTNVSPVPLRIDKAPEADHVRYWHHPESSCVLRTGPGTDSAHPDEQDGDPNLCEIDEAEYIRLSALYDDL